MTHSTCLELVGDGSVFDQKMRATYRKVYNMAFRLSGNKPDAEDLTQEAFIRAYRSFDDYEGDKPFENWIFRIVTRLFLDLRRARRRRIKAVSYDAPWTRDGGEEIVFDIPDHDSNPERQVMATVMNEDIEGVLGILTPEQRLLVDLADVEGLPHKDIAEIIGKPVGTIRSRLHRMHKLLREQLAIRAQRRCAAAT
jgi:RNA polymerase sigma-70 factor (ECF subfamily)